MSGLELPPKGTYQAHFAHPHMVLLHVPPQSAPPMTGKESVAASSTLLRVLPGVVTHVRSTSQIPLPPADDTLGCVPSHLPSNLRIPVPNGQGPGKRPCPAGTHPLGWFSVSVRRLEGARAAGFACPVVCSGLLIRASLGAPGGPGV